MPTTLCPGAALGCVLPRAEFHFWFHGKSNPEWEDSCRQEGKQHLFKLSTLILISISTTRGSIDMQQEKYRLNSVKCSFQARLSQHHVHLGKACFQGLLVLLRTLEVSPGLEVIAHWLLSCVSYFTRFIRLWHHDGEDWEIYNYALFFGCFLNYAAYSFQWILFWRLSERIYYLLSRKAHYRLAQVDPKNETSLIKDAEQWNWSL